MNFNSLFFNVFFCALSLVLMGFSLSDRVSTAHEGRDSVHFDEVSQERSVHVLDIAAEKIKVIQEKVHRELPKYIKALKSGESVWQVLISFTVAFLYGVVHTLGPGHAKTIVSTYFLTHKSSYFKGILLGLSFSITHVSGSIILVFLTNISLKTLIFNSDTQLFVVKFVSYVALLVVSLFMVIRAFRHAFSPALEETGAHSCMHCAVREKKKDKEGALLTFSAGLVPCTGSLIILLYAMAHDVLVYGVLMVLFLALGMSFTLIGIGFCAIFAQRRYSDLLVGRKAYSHKVKIAIEFVGAFLLLALSLLFLYSLYS